MSGNDSIRPEITYEVRHAIFKWTVQSMLGVVGYGLILFVSAGRLDWLWGWAFLVLLACFLVAHPLILVPIHPELLAERQKGSLAKGVKTWDKWITSLTGGLMLLTWIVAGLDLRFQWTGPMPLATHLAGLLLNVLGYALFLWAMVSNAYFAEGVRIQTERGHVMATGGPYRFVRHPGYTGVIVAHLATPFLLGSPWAVIPGAALAALFVLRTALEDKTLTQELPGYRDYARQTRFRLAPGIW